MDRRELPLTPGTLETELAAVDSDVVILDPDASGRSQAMFDPDKWYLLIDRTGAHFDDVSNVTTYSWADEQVGFLAGSPRRRRPRPASSASSAPNGPLTTRRSSEPGSKPAHRRSTPTSRSSPRTSGSSGYGSSAPFDAPDLARYVAGLLYDGGADVIFHAAGRSGVGVLQAADSGLAANHRWAIGVDSDEWQAASARHRPHILTSIVKRFDEQIYTAIEDHLDGGLEAGASGSPSPTR